MAENSTEAAARDVASTPTVEPVESGTAIHERGWSKLKSLDGNSRIYTLSILTTLAFSIATVYFDIGFMETEEDELLLDRAAAIAAFTTAGRQIFRALLLLLLCIFLAGNGFFLLGINVYPFSEHQLSRHRWWLILSFISATFMNLVVFYIVVVAEIEYEERSESEKEDSGFSHYWLFLFLLVSVSVMNFHYLMAFTTSYQQLTANERKGWARARARLSSILRLGREGTAATPESSGLPLHRRARNLCRGILEGILKGILWAMNQIVYGMRRMVGMRDENDATQASSMKYVTYDVSEFLLDKMDWIESSPMFRSLHRTASYLTWDMWRPLRQFGVATREDPENRTMRYRLTRQMTLRTHETYQYWRQFGEQFRGQVDLMYEDVREDEHFKHSAWVLAAMSTSLVLLIYFGFLLSARTSGYLHKTYIPRRNCAVGSMDKNGELGNFMFRMAGFTEGSEEEGKERRGANAADEQALAAIGCSLEIGLGELALPGQSGVDPTAIDQELAALLDRDLETEAEEIFDQADMSPRETLSDGRFYQCSSESYSSNSCPTLLMVNQLERRIRSDLNETKEPREVFHDHAIGRSIYVLDTILQHLEWSIWIGLMVGLAVGIYSLMSVLAQYKRFSLAIRSGFFTDLPISENLAVLTEHETNIKRLQSVVTERRWVKLIELYPMGASVFFFGILVSTAVIQLAVFGGAVAVLLAFIVSVFDSHVFTILRPYLALLIAFLITWFLNGPLAQMVISEGILVQKYRVYHELCFLLFLLIYTSVHLVLGVFFALMRLIWVLLTTIACLNRLDRNLFPMFQRNDLGHKSFMSMVLMQHAFLSNADTGQQFLFSELYDALQRRAEKGSQEEKEPQPALSVYSTTELDVVVQSLMGNKEERRDLASDDVVWYLRNESDPGVSHGPQERPPDPENGSGDGIGTSPIV